MWFAMNISLGKLRWMSDLIGSADNALSNPTRRQRIDSEAMVLFSLTKDEERQSGHRRAESVARKCDANGAGRAWRDFEAAGVQGEVAAQQLTRQQAEAHLRRRIKLRRSIENIPEGCGRIHGSWPTSIVGHRH